MPQLADAARDGGGRSGKALPGGIRDAPPFNQASRCLLPGAAAPTRGPSPADQLCVSAPRSQASMSQLNSSLNSLDGFLLSGTLDVTSLAASADSVAAVAMPPQPTTSSTLSALAAAEVRNPAQGCG